MRVLLLINGTDFGGTESALGRLAARLVRRGHQVRVWSLKPLGRLGRQWQADGLAVESLGMAEQIGPANVLAAVWRLTRRLRAAEIDLVHSFLPRANVLSRIANRCSGRRRPHLSSERSTDYQRSAAVRWLNRLTARWTDLVLAVSPAVRELLITRDRIPAEKVRLLANGIDVADLDAQPASGVRYELGIEPARPLFCAVGRLIPDKGYDYLLRALARLGRDDAHLLLVGEGPEEARLRQEAERLGLGRRVHFLGYRSDVAGILKEADAFVLSSLEEGVPVVLLEAMACSLPVVATRVGGVPDLVAEGETALLVPPPEAWQAGGGAEDLAAGERGVAALAEAMDQLAGDAELRRRLGRAGRERLERQFSLERIVSRLEELYALALAGAGAGIDERAAAAAPLEEREARGR